MLVELRLVEQRYQAVLEVLGLLLRVSTLDYFQMDAAMDPLMALMDPGSFNQT